jgi:ribosome biogenesis GTPase
MPIVGDWVAARIDPHGSGATIEQLLPRRGALVRKSAGGTSTPQLLAANVDVAFLVSSLNHDWNPRRVERALAMIWESGAQPVLLLTKLDLCPDPTPQLAAASEVALGVPVHALSVYEQRGLAVLAEYLAIGRTVALIGSSGVGKSTLVNHLLGESRTATRAIRSADDRGRHTTTHRELFELPSGGLLIDTPGLREIGLFDAEAGIELAFEDIEQRANDCRFHDCRHGGEPGCAIAAAIANGELDRARYAAYQKLKREEAHQARRADQRLAQTHRVELRKLHKRIKSEQKRHSKR